MIIILLEVSFPQHDLNRTILRLEPCLFKGKTPNPGSNPLLMQQQITGISNEMNNHKKEVQVLRSEKDTLESVLTMKTADVKKSLSNELVRIE